MATINFDFPQVYYVRVPDPDCKETLSKCQQVMLPVDGFAVQDALWKYDTNRNHVLDAADLSDDVAMAIPANAAQRLAEIVTGVQYLTNAAYKFPSPQAVIDFTRTDLAITKAYDTVQFLNSLPSRQFNERDLEVEYNAQDWTAIVARLGVGAKAYAEQLNAAHASFDQFVASAKVRDWKFEHSECSGGQFSSCWTVRDAWVFDPTLLSPQLQQQFASLAQKVAIISGFAAYGEIECDVGGCPANSESRSPRGDHFHGPRVAMRIADSADKKPVFLQLSAPFGMAAYTRDFDLSEALSYMTFATTFSAK